MRGDSRFQPKVPSHVVLRVVREVAVAGKPDSPGKTAPAGGSRYRVDIITIGGLKHRARVDRAGCSPRHDGGEEQRQEPECTQPAHVTAPRDPGARPRQRA